MEPSKNGAKTRQQMADEYGVCRKTFNKILSRNGIRIRQGLIIPRDQKLIYDTIGQPFLNGKQ
jgi:hypothetical protein